MSRVDTDLLNRITVSLSNTPKYIVQQATLSIIASVPGVLHAVNIASNSSPTCTFYDNASGASGTVLLLTEPGAKHSYVADVSYVFGVTAYVQPGNAPAISVSLRNV